MKSNLFVTSNGTALEITPKATKMSQHKADQSTNRQRFQPGHCRRRLWSSGGSCPPYRPVSSNLRVKGVGSVEMGFEYTRPERGVPGRGQRVEVGKAIGFTKSTVMMLLQ